MSNWYVKGFFSVSFSIAYILGVNPRPPGRIKKKDNILNKIMNFFKDI